MWHIQLDLCPVPVLVGLAVAVAVLYCDPVLPGVSSEGPLQPLADVVVL